MQSNSARRGARLTTAPAPRAARHARPVGLGLLQLQDPTGRLPASAPTQPKPHSARRPSSRSAFAPVTAAAPPAAIAHRCRPGHVTSPPGSAPPARRGGPAPARRVRSVPCARAALRPPSPRLPLARAAGEAPPQREEKTPGAR